MIYPTNNVASERPLHIMLIAPGNSVHSLRFLQMLLDEGYRVTFVDDYNPIPERDSKYSFIPYPTMFGLEKFGLRTLNRLGYWIKALQLGLIWRSLKPDIVHVHWVDIRASHCASLGLHPLVLTCWGSDINNLFNPQATDAKYRQRIAEALRRAAHVTADSPEVLERCNILVGKQITTSLFYFGIDLKRFRTGYAVEARQLRKTLHIPPSAKVFLSIRRLHPALGHTSILRAFAKATSTSNVHAVILFHRYLVSELLYEQELKELARLLGIGSNLIWIDALPNEQMPVLYSLTDVVVNFPVYDGFPVSLFEAAACKKPIITSNLPAYQDFLSVTNVTIVPPGDEAQLADALALFMGEPAEDLADQLKANYAVVAELGDQNKCFQTIYRLYEQLANSRVS